jgi:hypothetical protein
MRHRSPEARGSARSRTRLENEKEDGMAEKKKAKTRKSMRNLPAKAVKTKTAKGVKGGAGFTYGAIEWTYKPQKPDGTQ